MNNRAATASVLSLGMLTLGLASIAVHNATAQPDVRNDVPRDRSFDTMFVINSPSARSRGADSILTFDFRGRSTVLFGPEQEIVGLRSVACDPYTPQHILVAHNTFSPAVAGLFIFDAAGRHDNVPSGTPGENVSLAFDRFGNFYVTAGTEGTIFKNDRVLATLPYAGIGQLAVDTAGTLFLTDPSISPRIFRITPTGTVSVFADASMGLDRPYGLAVDSQDNIYVANNPGGNAAYILKFDPFGRATPFATNISLQPGIRSMAFDNEDNLYATLETDNIILTFDKHGNSRVFADASDGLNYPTAIAFGNCPIRIK